MEILNVYVFVTKVCTLYIQKYMHAYIYILYIYKEFTMKNSMLGTFMSI